MGLKDKMGFKAGGTMWRISLLLTVPVCLLSAGALWMSGTYETQSAFDSGRRLVIRLDNGAIQGREVRIEGPDAKAIPVDKKDGTTLADALPFEPSASPIKNVNPDLVEKTAEGFIPKIGSDNTKPWRFYAKPFEAKTSVPMIAIIITGLGQSKGATDAATRLPENVTLSFSPYASHTSSWATAARMAGHEIMLDLPLQPANYPASDPGPYGLLVAKGDEGNAKNLRWVMSRTESYTGFTMPRDEGFSADAASFRTLLQTLSDRGLMLVISQEPPKTETKDIIKAGAVASIVADQIIDEDLTPTAIQTRLSSLEQIARTRGYAVGIAQSLPITLKEIGTWSARLADQGFMLVPLSAITKQLYS